jgi:hypothetical protein
MFITYVYFSLVCSITQKARSMVTYHSNETGHWASYP